MSIQVLSESTPKARKDHDCMASDFILASGSDGFGYSFAELRVIAKAKKHNYKIVKGQKYIKQNNKADGELYTFKAIPEMHQICLDHGHYEF
tara:strand:- start:67 stop:342 length:276 start_codon:yes stop_codon:yes gene_type:complete